MARLVPERRGSREAIRQAVARLRDLRKRIAKRSANELNLAFDEVKAAVEAGRR